MWLYIFQNAMWFFRSEKLACSHGFLTTELTRYYILNRFSCLMIYSQKSVKPLFPLMIIFKSKEILPNWQVGQKIHLSRFFLRNCYFLLMVWYFFHKLLRIARKKSAGQRGSLNSKKCPPRQRVLFIPKGVSSLEQRRRDVTLV